MGKHCIIQTLFTRPPNMSTSTYELASPPTSLQDILAVETSLVFDSFTLNDAHALGESLRNRLLTFPQASVIEVARSTGPQTVYRSAVNSARAQPGVVPDNDEWVRRKQTAVIRFNASTYYLHYKYQEGNLELFKKKLFLSDDKAGQYALHGGGFPVRVANVDGIVGVICVSGLKHDQDHQIIVQTVTDYIEASRKAGKPTQV